MALDNVLDSDIRGIMKKFRLSWSDAADAIGYFGRSGTAFIVGLIQSYRMPVSCFKDIILPARRLMADMDISGKELCDLFETHQKNLFTDDFPLYHALEMHAYDSALANDRISPPAGVFRRRRLFPFSELDPLSQKKVGNRFGECQNEEFDSHGADEEADYVMTKENQE